MLLESQAIRECFKIIKKTEESLNKSVDHFRTTQNSLKEAVAKIQAAPKVKH